MASNNDLPRASTHLNPALDWCPSACLSHLFLELMRYAASVGVGRAVGGLVHLFHVAWKVAWPGCTEISKSVHHKRHVSRFAGLTDTTNTYIQTTPCRL